MQVKDVMQAMERLAPARLKEDWDNVGLQLGDPQAAVKRVMLALTPSETVVEEAIARGADMIVTHHPFIFKGVKAMTTDSALGRMAQRCLKHDIAIFSAHTNLDIAEGGVNDVLAARLGLVDVEGLEESWSASRCKVVVFVPVAYAEAVKLAMFAAGGGAQGAYRVCAWQVNGQGQFLPQEGAAPFLGTVGAVERVEEARLEVLVDRRHLAAVLAAMKSAHPYEEVAYDVFQTEGSVERAALGRIGRLPEPQPLLPWLETVKTVLDLPLLSYAGASDTMVERVALCGGSACEFMGVAQARGADVYLSGDMKYHDAQQVVERGMVLVDLSHYGGERPVLAAVRDYLHAAFDGALDVMISTQEENFIQYLR